MYCNLDTSWRKVDTFRVWGKRPGYPVHGSLLFVYTSCFGSARVLTAHSLMRLFSAQQTFPSTLQLEVVSLRYSLQADFRPHPTRFPLGVWLSADPIQPCTGYPGLLPQTLKVSTFLHEVSRLQYMHFAVYFFHICHAACVSHSADIRCSYCLHRPVVSLSCLQKSAHYAVFKVFGSLACRLMGLMNEKPQLK